jgi:hypothetical protein
MPSDICGPKTVVAYNDEDVQYFEAEMPENISKRRRLS